MKDEQIFRFDFTASGGNQEADRHESVETIERSGLSYALILDYYSGSMETLADHNALIVRCTDLYLSHQQVLKIRSHQEGFLFLKPIFLLHPEDPPPELNDLYDGHLVHLDRLDQMADRAHRILQNCLRLKLRRQDRYEDTVLFNTLAFACSRDRKVLAPVPSRRSPTGYYYPVLSSVGTQSDHPAAEERILRIGERGGYLAGHFLESSHLCNQCANGFLLYREVCPSCHSADLKSEHIIHHFRCAHMAPVSAYQQEPHQTTLTCPKCEHELRHIGVDYDKPTMMHYCRRCEAEFQDYVVRAKCVACGHDQDVEHLVKFELKAYDILPKAIESLVSGRLGVGTQHRGGLLEDVVAIDVFIKAVQYLSTRYPEKESYLVTLSFSDMASLNRQLGDHHKWKLINELCQIVKGSQKGGDIRAVDLPQIHFTLLQTNEKEAVRVADRTIFLINHLLRDNLGLKHSIITHELMPLVAFENARVQSNKP